MALILDGTAGIGISGGTQPLDPTSLNAVIQALIPSGTSMLFAQTNAPTGWTKSTTHNNKALRVVSGTAGSGGSVAFTTAFASQAVSGTVANHTLTTAQMPSHSHFTTIMRSFSGNDRTNDRESPTTSTSEIGAQNWTSSSTGSTNAHSHGFTGTAINLAVQYVDVIIATKD